MRRHSAHVESIGLVAHRLAPLGIEFVFTGGAVVGLLLTDRAAPDVRPTDDVDVIVGIAQFANYVSLQDDLRKLGLKHDMDGPNCRFILDGLKVDVMPSEGKILGFTNRWYDFAMRSAKEHFLPDGTVIRLISAPAFIATKFEAFHDRGKGDFVASHDMEDIIAVVDGRPELLAEVRESEDSVRQYIAERCTALVNNQGFLNSIGMHLMPDESSQARSVIITDRLRALSSINGQQSQ